MRQNFLKYVLPVVLFAMAIMPMLVAAQQQGYGSLPTTSVTSPQAFVDLMCRIAGWMFTFLVILAVIFVIYAAFKYLTAGGEPGEVGKASSMLIYAAVAIAVAIFAKAFPLIIGGFFNTPIAGCQ